MEKLLDYLNEIIEEEFDPSAPVGGVYDVTKLGAVGDGVTNNTECLRGIIDQMKNGGILFFPPGRYVTGALVLKSNTTLYISTGATILGSDILDDFPLISEAHIDGYDRGGRFALISAFRARNITITGGGTIDGRGYNWWEAVPKDHGRPRSIQPMLCDNVRIRDITVKNSPSWTIVPTCCHDVVIDGVTVRNPQNAPNTDGINPESCQNVRIVGCSVSVGDDCITLKSGTEDDTLQKRFPCENITVTGCTLLDGHGGVVIGSEMSGGVRNVTVTGCVFNGTDRGVRIKSRRKRGGSVSGLMFSNLYMTDVHCPFTMNLFYRCGTDRTNQELFSYDPKLIADDNPIIEDISISNVVVRNAKVAAMYIIGLPERPIRGLRVSDFSVETVVDPKVCTEAVMLPEKEKLQGRGIRLDNVADSDFTNIRATVAVGDLLTTKNVSNVTFNGELL